MLKDGINIMIKEVKQNMMTMSHQIENINTEKFFKKLILVLRTIKVIQKVHQRPSAVDFKGQKTDSVNLKLYRQRFYSQNNRVKKHEEDLIVRWQSRNSLSLPPFMGTPKLQNKRITEQLSTKKKTGTYKNSSSATKNIRKESHQDGQEGN